MTSIHTPRGSQLVPSRGFFLPHSHPSSNLVPLYLSPRPMPARPSTSSTSSPPPSTLDNSSSDDDQPKACLEVICVVCDQSSAWFSPMTPPVTDRLGSSSPSTRFTRPSTLVNVNVNPHRSSTSSLDHPNLTERAYQPDSAHRVSLDSEHKPSPVTPKVSPPVWVSGRIHALCSRCQSLARLAPSQYQSSDEDDMPTRPSRPHPVSFFSDATPLTPSSPSTVLLPSPSISVNLQRHNVDADDGTMSSSGSSCGSGSASSAKLFRLSFIEPSLRAQDTKPPPALTANQFDTPRAPNPDSRSPLSEHVIQLDLPPRRKPHRGVLPYVSEPKEVLATVNESPSPNCPSCELFPQSSGGGAHSSNSNDTPSSYSSSGPRTVNTSPVNNSPVSHVDRGASLRSLLRQAKIPPPDSDRSSLTHQGHIRTASEIWEAALIVTSREPRTIQPPSWHSYVHSRSEERVHRHVRMPSNGSNLSSFQSHPLAPSTSNHSLQIAADGDNRLPSQTSSLRQACADRTPISEDGAAIKRRPILSTAASASAFTTPPPHHQARSWEPNVPQRFNSDSPHSISISNIPAPLLRQSSSHGLFGRFMGRKDFVRRPNTATGSSSHSTSNKTFDHLTPSPSSVTPTPTRTTPPAVPLSRVLALAHPLPTTKRPSTGVASTVSAAHSSIRAQRPATAVASPRPLLHRAPALPAYLPQPPPNFAMERSNSQRSKPNPRRLSRSVSPTVFSGVVPVPFVGDRSSSKLPPEEFHSKSRSLTISISPRPSSDTFRPGQKLTIYVRRNSGSSRRKYGTVGIVLSGRFVERKNGQSHEFLKVIKPVVGGGAAEVAAGVKMIGNGGDEWTVELIIPEYATCGCSPGALPLPSAGINSLGEVSYTIQLFAEKKQFISSQETITVKFHLTESVDRRIGGHLTTRPTSVKSSKGRIVFAAGHLGSIEDYSLSHSLYFFHPDRVEIFYAFEVRFGPHSNLPKPLIDRLALSAQVELRRLVGDNKPAMRGVTDRRAPGWTPIENGWMISGSLEVTDITALSSPASPTVSSVMKSRNRERVEQSHRITSQLFLLVTVQDGSGEMGVLGGKKLELSGVIGPSVISDCALRTLALRGGMGNGGLGRSTA